jgi:hypothetical protein
MNVMVCAEGAAVISDEKIAAPVNEHFGRDEPKLTWERVDKMATLRVAASLQGPHRRSQRRALYVFGGWYLAAASAAMSIALCILSVVTSSSELTAEKAPLLMMTISTMAI